MDDITFPTDTDSTVSGSTQTLITNAGAKVELLINQPIPTSSRGRKRKPLDETYPFTDMVVGASFVVSGKKEVQQARNAAQQWAKEHETWKFITRNLSGHANPHGGVYPADTIGVWRVPPTSTVVRDTTTDHSS